MRALQSKTRITVVRSVTLAIGIFLAVLWSESAAGEDWHTKWRRVRLTTNGQLRQAKEDIKNIIQWSGTATYRASQLAKKVNADRYEPLSFAEKRYGARYAPLCRLEMAQLRQSANPQERKRSETKFCSCAFVRPDVLMTAAHCFLPPDDNWDKGANQGKVLDVRPATGWLVYVVQAYGGEASPDKFAEYTLEHAQLVIEWWTPAVYTGNEADFEKQRYADVAFAKVHNENAAQAKRPVYELRTPVGKLAGADAYSIFDDNVLVMQLGYPRAYQDAETAVRITGKVSRCDKESEEGRAVMAFFGQATKETKEPGIMSLLLDINQKEAASACPIIVGNMGVGGSGGPLILANSDVGKSGKKALNMATFGVMSSSVPDADNDPTRRSTYALIQAEMVEALDQIAKLKLDFKAPQNVAGVAKAEATTDEGKEMVVIELPRAAAEKAKKTSPL